MRLFTQILELSLPVLVDHHALVKNLGFHNNGMNAIYFHNRLFKMGKLDAFVLCRFYRRSPLSTVTTKSWTLVKMDLAVSDPLSASLLAANSDISTE